MTAFVLPLNYRSNGSSLLYYRIMIEMKKSKTGGFISIVTALLMVLSPLNAQSNLGRNLVVSYDRFGPVKIGMTRSQAAKALGVSVLRGAGYEGNDCYYASPKTGFKDIAFMMSGRSIVRIDIGNKDYATDKGAKIGDSEARIKLLYKGFYEVSPHKYVEGGHYIEVKVKGRKNIIIFETDGKLVVNYRVGKPEQVGYVEGCS